MLEEKNIKIEDYDYSLPEDRIAFYPLQERDQSKLLVYRNNIITDTRFADLPGFIDEDTLLVFNDSKVIHARLQVYNKNGVPVEIFCLEPVSPTSDLAMAFQQTKEVLWKCMVGNAKRWKEEILFSVEIAGKSIEITAGKGDNVEGVFFVTFRWDDGTVTFGDWIEAFGKMPLPPYIKRKAETEDEERYQTIYAGTSGSVAAPTAGLHFSEEVMNALKEKGIGIDYVTLHVGAGTFKPVSAALIGEHFMHREQVMATASLIRSLLENKYRKVIPVGTTSARTLESLFLMGAKLHLHLADPFNIGQWEAYENTDLCDVSREDALKALQNYQNQQNTGCISGSTSLIILPGYRHKITGGLLTNFHQPKSTLLLLIASYLQDSWKEIYAHALANEYRFLSYGDSNLYIL